KKGPGRVGGEPVADGDDLGVALQSRLYQFADGYRRAQRHRFVAVFFGEAEEVHDPRDVHAFADRAPDDEAPLPRPTGAGRTRPVGHSASPLRWFPVYHRAGSLAIEGARPPRRENPARPPVF